MILCIPPKTLSSQQKSAIAKKGYIIIECDDPDKVKVINPVVNIETNEYLMSALFAMTTKAPAMPSTKPESFINELYRRLSENEKRVKETVDPPETDSVQK